MLRRWLTPKSRKFRYLATSSALLLAIVMLFLLGRWYFLVPDFSGNWYFKGGDYLLIKQDGDHFEIERIDPAMQKTYEKGSGVIKGRRMEFNLEPIYTAIEASWN